MIPVPEGTRIIEYAGVPIEERTGEPIRMVRDLEIGRNTEDHVDVAELAWPLALAASA